MRTALLLSAISLTLGCTPRADQVFTVPGSLTTGSSGAQPGYAIKLVQAKQAPTEIVADDGSLCRLTAQRFSQVDVGEWIACGWTIAPEPVASSGAQDLQAQTVDSDSAAIHEAARAFSAAYMRGDADAMTELYTSDGVLFPEQSAPITGHEAIRRYWTVKPGRRITRHVLIPTRITVDGRHAYDHGAFEIAGERDGTPWGPVRGKYLVVWRREGDRWRMHLDMWNSGPQPPS